MRRTSRLLSIAALSAAVLPALLCISCGQREKKMSDATSGKWSGQGLPDPARFELTLERPFDEENGFWQNRAYVNFTTVGGEVTAARIHAPNNTTYADWTCRVREADFRAADGKIHAAFETNVVTGKRWGGPARWTFAIDGRAAAGDFTGTFVTRRKGEVRARGKCTGSVAPASIPGPKDAYYPLELHAAVPGGRAMWVHLECRDGSFGEGLAFTPRFNHAVHDVDARGLKLHGSKLTGPIEVTVHADPYMPKDGKSIPCAYEIDAQIDRGGLSGTFEGTFGGDKVPGDAAASLQPLPDFGRDVRLWMKFEEGVTGGPAWFNRTYLGVTLDDGRAVKGSFSNNKGGWEGRFDRADLSFDGRNLAGTVTCTVTSGKVRTGAYTFTLDGRAVGTLLKGTFESKLDGEVVQAGRFMGRIESVKPSDAG